MFLLLFAIFFFLLLSGLLGSAFCFWQFARNGKPLAFGEDGFSLVFLVSGIVSQFGLFGAIAVCVLRFFGYLE